MVSYVNIVLFEMDLIYCCQYFHRLLFTIQSTKLRLYINCIFPGQFSCMDQRNIHRVSKKVADYILHHKFTKF